jgi:Tfp pilus assembly protein PilE
MAATNQERFYLQNNQFSGDLTQLGFSANPFTTDTGSYVITVAAPIPTANFTVTATYQLGGTEAAKCNVFSITGSGVKASSPDLNCWTRTR